MRRIESFSIISGLALIAFELTGCGSSSIGSGPPIGGSAVGGSGANVGGQNNNGGAGFQVGSGGTAGTAGVGVNQGTAPPGCGDGTINQTSEVCDDGNTLAGDGCNGICQVEPNHVCPLVPGDPTHNQPCVVSFKCGDGVVNPGEVCDQGTFQGSPGCSADCKTQTAGYKCVAGQQCVATFACGNSRIETGETCDPPSPGNGCSATCQAEAGWRCKPGSCAKLPYCGDGIVQADQGEKCDQGAYKASPGCSDDCLSMDATCTCSPGKACVCQAPVCGDGIVQVGEKCDDKNSAFPGCDASCQLEPGYQCPFAGAPCVPLCGDGILTKPAEQCDPGANIPNVAQACYSAATADATHPACSVRPGWVCTATTCTQTVCGDGKIEGSEGCDPTPKNNDLGDGCSATCMVEPQCPAGGGACTTKCGDGLVLSGEACDDGNAVSGDGCSATCTIEAGFTCSQPALGDTMLVPMVVRDFNAGADFQKGGAFEKEHNFITQGLLQGTLDSSGLKPVLVSTTGVYNGVAGTDSGIASIASFAQWYKDGTGSPNAYNGTLATSLNLYLITGSNPPAYANRYGVNGNGLTSAKYQRLQIQNQYCGDVGREDHDANGVAIPCTACYYDNNPATPQCDPPVVTTCQSDPTYTQCIQVGNQWNGVYVKVLFEADGNPLFFPADPLTPASPSMNGQISGNYDPSWPMQSPAVMHNFSFTTETRFWFKYDSSLTYNLKFVGDDDVWVFINKKLAVDLGGIHSAAEGNISFTGATGAGTTTVTQANVNITPAPTPITSTVNLGLTNGGVYEIAVFQAERQTTASSYQLTLGGFNASKSICKPVCGGTNPAVSPGEQCDNGTAGNCDPATASCYNKCTTTCTLGARCGDGAVQVADGEECDNGTNTDGYAAAGSNACTPSCKKPPSCGDGNVQLDYGEECDAAAANSDTAYDGCNSKCKLGPSCGDGAVNGDATHPEACDDGINDGTYGTCSPGCTLPPRCLDGIVQADWGEECEPSLDSNCNQLCKLAAVCGDGKVDATQGEACDYGACASGQTTPCNNGDWGACNSNCSLAPYCGDGVTNGPEKCDLGAAGNTGEYGGCTSTCLLGPYCGDALTNGSEDCDDGANNGLTISRCTTSCKKYLGGAG